MKPMSLSRVVVSREGDRLISFQQAAYLTQTSVTILERFADFGIKWERCLIAQTQA